MHAPPDHWPGQPRYRARLELHLDARTQTKITHIVTAFRRSQSEVIRYVLQWGLTHGQGWMLDRGRPPSRAQRIFLRIEPERRQQVREAARSAGGDVSAWLRHTVHQVTIGDFPASWHAAARHTTRRDTAGKSEMRSHDSRTDKQRDMLRLDNASWRKLAVVVSDGIWRVRA